MILAFLVIVVLLGFSFWVFKPLCKPSKESFEQLPQGLPSPFFLSYVPFEGCTNCAAFELVWDAFVLKNMSSFFEPYYVFPTKTPYICPCASKPANLGHPTYPAIRLADMESRGITVFDGPYTDKGLNTFVKQFIVNHPDRLSKLTLFRKKHPDFKPHMT